MTIHKKLLILWAIVFLSYALLAVLTNPVVTMPYDQQLAVFRAYKKVEGTQSCWPPPEGVVASRLGLTYRNVRLIVRHGYEQGWWVDRCAPYR